MSIRVSKPGSKRLTLSQDDWLDVKTHLTAGEQRGVFARMMRHGVDGDRIDSVKVGLAKMVGYLIDWSFQDTKGDVILIRDQSPDVVESALNAIDTDAYAEALKAIETHEAEMEQARSAEKNGQAGESASSPTLPSAA